MGIMLTSIMIASMAQAAVQVDPAKLPPSVVARLHARGMLPVQSPYGDLDRRLLKVSLFGVAPGMRLSVAKTILEKQGWKITRANQGELEGSLGAGRIRIGADDTVVRHVNSIVLVDSRRKTVGGVVAQYKAVAGLPMIIRGTRLTWSPDAGCSPLTSCLTVDLGGQGTVTSLKVRLPMSRSPSLLPKVSIAKDGTVRSRR